LPKSLPHCETVYLFQCAWLNQSVLCHLEQRKVIDNIKPKSLLNQIDLNRALISILRSKSALAYVKTASDISYLLLQKGDLIFSVLKLFWVNQLKICLVKYHY